MFWAVVILIFVAIVTAGVYLGLRLNIGLPKEEHETAPEPGMETEPEASRELVRSGSLQRSAE